MEIAIYILGSMSFFMIFSSFLQLSSTYVSYNSILWGYFINIVNIVILTILTTVITAHPYFIYTLVAFMGIIVGFYYSAGMKFSLMFPLPVSRYLTGGISFSAIFHFGINFVILALVVDENDVATYYKGVRYSLGAAALALLAMLISILLIRRRLPLFLEAERKIGNFYLECTFCEDKNNASVTPSTSKIIGSIHSGDVELKQRHQHIGIKDLEENALNNINNNNNDSSGNTSTIVLNCENTMSKESTVKQEKVYSIESRTSHLYNMSRAEKWRRFWRSFNYRNVFLGAQLIKYYFGCYLGVSYTVLNTFATYPHIIPNKLNKELYTLHMFMLMYQTSDLMGNFLIIYSVKLRGFLKTRNIVILTLLRTVLVGLALYISTLNDTYILYSDYAISALIILLGLSNGSLINMSYSNIPGCFEDNNLKDRSISAASSFSALGFLTSFALSPWYSYFLTNVILKDH